MKSAPIQAPGAEDVRHVRGDRERGVTQRGGVAGECLAHADEHGAERDDEPRTRRSCRAEQTEKREDSPERPSQPTVSPPCVGDHRHDRRHGRAGTGDELRLERDARDGRHDEQRDRRERDPSGARGDVERGVVGERRLGEDGEPEDRRADQQ